MKMLILFLTLTLGTPTMADQQQTNEAIKKTQQEMRGQGFADQAGKTSPEAEATAKQVKGLAGSKQNEADIYSLSADVLGNFQNMSPEEMMKVLQEAQSNPEAFANRFTPEQRKKLKELSERLPAAQKRNP